MKTNYISILVEFFYKLLFLLESPPGICAGYYSLRLLSDYDRILSTLCIVVMALMLHLWNIHSYLAKNLRLYIMIVFILQLMHKLRMQNLYYVSPMMFGFTL